MACFHYQTVSIIHFIFSLCLSRSTAWGSIGNLIPGEFRMSVLSVMCQPQYFQSFFDTLHLFADETWLAFLACFWGKGNSLNFAVYIQLKLCFGTPLRELTICANGEKVLKKRWYVHSISKIFSQFIFYGESYVHNWALPCWQISKFCFPTALKNA